MAESETANSVEQKQAGIRPVIIADTRQLRRYSVFLEHLFFGLSEELDSVALVCPAEGQTDFVYSAVRIIRHPAYRLPFLWRQNRRQLLSSLEKFRPTIIHSFSMSKPHLAKQLANHFAIPSVISLNSESENYDFLRRPLISNFDAVVCSSKTIYQQLTKSQRMADKVKLLNMGTFVEPDVCCFSRDDYLASMIVIHPLNHLADFAPLLSAVRHLAIDGCEFVLVIAGKGPAEHKIRKMVKSLGLSAIVNIVPAIHPVRPVLGGADIFIQPQPVHHLNAFLFEAVGVGLAVAACANGSGDLLADGQSAIIFEPDDELSIYAALHKLLDDRRWARKIAAAGQHILRQNFTVSAMVGGFVELYKTLQQKLRR